MALSLPGLLSKPGSRFPELFIPDLPQLWYVAVRAALTRCNAQASKLAAQKSRKSTCLGPRLHFPAQPPSLLQILWEGSASLHTTGIAVQQN